MSAFLETVQREFNRMQARHFASDGYEGVTVAGIAIVARDSGLVLMAQRTFDDTDDPEVAESWEFPGGHLEPGEDPFTAAVREYEEEVGLVLPPGDVVNGWRAGDEGQYQGFVYAIDTAFDLTGWEANDEVQDVDWVDPSELTSPDSQRKIRPEVRKFDVALLSVSGNEKESEMDEDEQKAADFLAALTDTEPVLSMFDLNPGPIPIHGVLAPEDAPSGDGRGFSAGAVTRRPLRLPFRYQHADTGQHLGAVTVGSIDRVMRKDGLIHWEGSLMDTADAEQLFDLLLHFGRYGVSIDGDKGSLDMERSDAENMTWFDAVRVAAATAVGIPAFHEAYVALGPHPDMPTEDALVASMHVSGDLIGSSTYDRGPGWITNPRETKRIHDYWTKPGQPGYEKIAWGTNGDYTRCTRLVGEKIAKNSPEDMRFIKRICAQWHHDALGYWPGDLDMPGNDTTAEARAKREGGEAAASEAVAFAKKIKREGIEPLSSKDEHELESAQWEAVLVSSVSGNAVHPPLDYFHRPAALDSAEGGALVIEEPDESGLRRTYGYAAEWGVCHIGMGGRCVEPPRTYSDDYPEFHLGRTKVDGGGYVYTGVLTYGVGHRDAQTILRETAEQAYFDNINHAWAAVRVGEDERGVWFSGVVLPGVDPDHLVKIEASGQVSGEWLRGAMRACLTVNVPGYPVQRASAEYDEEGNVVALAASAFGQIEDAPCTPSPAERMAALRQADAEARMDALRESFNWTDVAEELMAEAQDDGRVEPVGLREDGAIVYEKDGEVPGTDTIVEPMPEEVE